MNSVDKDKLSRLRRRIEVRIANLDREAKKQRTSNQEGPMQYYLGARDEARKVLSMIANEFPDLRVVDIQTNGDLL